MRSLSVRKRSALLFAFTCGCSSYSPGTPCQQQRQRRSEEAAWSSTRPSSSSGRTESPHLSKTAAVSPELRKRRPPSAAPPTWNQLHHDVDGLALRAHANQLDDVGVVVLLQDPAGRQTGPPTGLATSPGPGHVTRASTPTQGRDAKVPRLTWLRTGSGFSAPKANLPCRF